MNTGAFTGANHGSDLAVLILLLLFLVTCLWLVAKAPIQYFAIWSSNTELKQCTKLILLGVIATLALANLYAIVTRL
jgi:hypothetical protein